MDHVAILTKANPRKGTNTLREILEHRKTIESRWYLHRIAPWNRIFSGDTVSFKESGEPVTAVAEVVKVIQFDNLTREKIQEIIKMYGIRIAPEISKEELFVWAENLYGRKYCILVFLENAHRIPPFNINKKGFGSAAAWLTVEDINQILKK